MNLAKELKLRRGFTNTGHEAILNIYHTASLLKQTSTRFFNEYGLTDVQYNLLVLIIEQCGDTPGLSQVELSDMMLVNRANITMLVDRMEKQGLVSRVEHPVDRRSKIVIPTKEGQKRYMEADTAYVERIDAITSFMSEAELKKLIKNLEKIREKIYNAK